MIKVNTLIAGTQKGGTTSLFHYLARHPEVGVADHKELHFFDNDKLFAKGQPDYAKYHRSFSHVLPAHRIFLEATPIYMYWSPSADRIHRYNPHMRLIFVLREPVQRAYSHWGMETTRDRESLSFRDAIGAEPDRIAKGAPKVHRRRHSYLDRGFYGRQVHRLLDYFPRTQMHFIRQDTLLSEHARVLHELCRFLGIDPFAKPPEAHFMLPIERRRTLPPFTEDMFLELAPRFHDDLQLLMALTGEDFSEWLAARG